MKNRVTIVFIIFALTVQYVNANDAAQDLESANRFLQQYCVDCHSSDDPAGSQNLSSLQLGRSHLSTQLQLQQVIDQLQLAAMPPEDADQPSATVRAHVISDLTNRLQEMRRESPPPIKPSGLRRLSKREYRRTVCDLLGIETPLFDPTQNFPAESLSHHFDNIGETLVTSGHLMDNYLEAADQAVDKALAIEAKPQVQFWSFDDSFRQQSQLDEAHRQAFDRNFLCLYDHPWNDKAEGAYGPLLDFHDGVPVDGIYEVRVLAKAMNRDSEYSKRTMYIDLEEPFRMGVRPGNTVHDDMENRQPIQPLLGETEVQDDRFRWYTFRIPLDRGFAPRFTFENGYHDFRGMIARFYRNEKQRLPKAALPDPNGIFPRRITLISHAELPHIRIDKVEIRGPVDTQWPTKSRELLFGGEEFDSGLAAEHIRRFADRAFRRPATDKEVRTFRDFYDRRAAKENNNAQLAFRDTVKAMLCSPSFLYFQRPTNEGGLSNHALAERLSYFLTSSLPDDKLRAAADRGRLTNDDELRSQVRRLLQSSASDAFVSDFLDSWLNLRSLGSMPPDVQKFRAYYAGGLQTDMKQETELFFRDMVQRNAPTIEFLTAKHSFVNRDLARLYGIGSEVSVESAARFRRVEFEDDRRGGLLGQASILTVSANGVDTSPVVRGVWMLENILGTPTPPPPTDVPAIEPDTRGTTTIREQLKKHRDNDSCRSCHRHIDPPGFAMECFDAIGQARTLYDGKKRQPIDTSGQLLGGQSFSDLGELKILLQQRDRFFARCLTQKLFTYALGRSIDETDRAAVEGVLTRVENQGYPTAMLIEEVILSDLFRTKSHGSLSR